MHWQFPEDSLPIGPQEVRQLVQVRLSPYLAELSRCGSWKELERHPLFPRVEPVLRQLLATLETGNHRVTPSCARDRYRFLAWNLERGAQLDGQLEVLRTHPYLKDCDVLLLTETDLGMARSGNRDVAGELARGLNCEYVFAPCYLNLTKGAGVEHAAEGENDLGLHGNAILSRYPIRNPRAVPLRNGADKMAGREKRLGRQVAVVADIEFPNRTVTAVSMHLDANSSQRHRRDQMRHVVDALPDEGAVVLGGDWNTNTFNSSRAFYSIMGYWRRLAMGPDYVIRNHYLHPERYFDRGIFRLLEERGYNYRDANQLGVGTVQYDVGNPKTYHGLAEWVPNWCFAFIRFALRNHGGRCPLKLDWFATRGVEAADPVVLQDVNTNAAQSLSDHDPIGVDIVV